MRKLRHPTSADFYRDAVVGSIRPFEVWSGTEGDDTYAGTNVDDTINGFGGADRLSGGKGSDLIDGGEGDDFLAGDAGDDLLRGGEGNDNITSTSGADIVDGGAGDDRWIGSYIFAEEALTFDERTRRLSNGTTLTGIEAVRLMTGSGDDRFTMIGEQAFSIDAGGGYDMFVFDATLGAHSATSLRIVVETKPTLGVSLRGDGISGDVANIESLTVVGSSADDVFRVKSSRFSNATAMIDGGYGNDRLFWNLSGGRPINFVVQSDGSVHHHNFTIANVDSYILTIAGSRNTLILGKGDDVVYASGPEGLIDGSGGNDALTSSGDKMKVKGGLGSDTINVDGRGCDVSGEEGDDIVFVAGSNTVIDGGDGNDELMVSLASGVDFSQSPFVHFKGITGLNFEITHIATSKKGIGSGIALTEDNYLFVTSLYYKDLVYIDMTMIDHGLVVDWLFNEDGSLDFKSGNIAADFLQRSRDNSNVRFVGSNFDDVISLRAQSAYDYVQSVDGNGGFDAISMALASNSRFIVNGDGSIVSSFGHYANLEQFHLTLLDGAYEIVLGAGDDLITVTGTSAGDSAITSGAGADRIILAQGADAINGGDGDDQLYGGDGDDVIRGETGDDLIDGGAGNDTAGYYTATAGVTVALVAGGQDTGGAGIDTLVSIENLNGSTFNDSLTGDDLANTLRGREGDDALVGGGGADRIEGGAGADRVYGGAGADVFAFVKLGDISLGVRDRILDFSHADGDKLDLSAIDLSKDPGDELFTFIGEATFTGSTTLYELRIQDQQNGTFLVQGDVDHDGEADFNLAVLAGATPLVATDFVL